MLREYWSKYRQHKKGMGKKGPGSFVLIYLFILSKLYALQILQSEHINTLSSNISFKVLLGTPTKSM